MLVLLGTGLSRRKAEGWQSGLMRRTRNAVGKKFPHKFKSCTLRPFFFTLKPINASLK